jgi:hypothetical protein
MQVLLGLIILTIGCSGSLAIGSPSIAEKPLDVTAERITATLPRLPTCH